MIEQLNSLTEEERSAFIDSLSDEEREELQKAQEEADAARINRLEQLGQTISGYRAEAIAARQLSGIEDEWEEDEEFYEGIDDANRGETSTWSSKPPGRAMPETDDTSSTIFLNITRPYCDAAGASMADMLLPTDDSAWHMENTPVPELIPFTKGEIPAGVQQAIRADTGGDEERAQAIEGKMIDQAQAKLAEAKEKVMAAQKRIEDWHVECQYHAEVRKVIDETAKLGSGVLKGPIPQKRKHMAYTEGQMVIEEEIKPGSKCISLWNFYPDAGCGESLHNGSYTFERDDIGKRQLRELIGAPGYIDSQIQAVLDEGPTEATKEAHAEAHDMKKRDTKNLFEIWYFHGDIEKEDLEAVFNSADNDCGCEELPDEMLSAQIVMVNNRVIKATMNPLDTGDFPYDIMVWQRRKGMPWGMGVSRQIRTCQRMINGAARNLMDNAGLAGGPMWAFNPGIITPIDGNGELAPRKGWIAGEDIDEADMSKAFTYFKLDMMVEELQSIISLGLKMAEDVTGLPAIIQGQMGSQEVKTLGQTQILSNNANIVRRRIARLFDDLVTEPHVRRYYAYLLQYGEDSEKGEFVIDARGSSNLVERTIQKEKTLELLQLSQNPVYKLDPKKVATEYLRSEKFDPKNFEYDDEDWEKLVQQLTQPQEQDPRAQIAQMQAEVAQLKIQSSEKIAGAELQAEALENDKEREFKVAVEQFKGQLQKAIRKMDYDGDKDLLYDKLKVGLHEKVIDINATKELSALGAAAKHMPTPPVEPAGRAPAGESYQK